MPFLKLKEIREMSSEERSEKIDELRAELSRLKSLFRVGGSIENPSRVREIKRAIARILTIEREENVER